MKKIYNSGLSLFLLMCGLMISLTACSNNKGEDMPDDSDPSASTNSDSVIVRLTPASGVHVNQDLNGILLGDTIYYDFRIVDTKAPKNTTYALTFEGEGSMDYHRRINQDFKLMIGKVEDGDSVKEWETINEFPYILPSSGLYQIKYITMSDGTFIHDLKIQRRVDGKLKGKITHQPVLFNVLRIELWFQENKYKRKRYRNDFYFKVRCGEFNTDQLFKNSGSSSNGRSYGYRIIYDEKEYSGTFQGEEAQCFLEGPGQKKRAPEVKNLFVSNFVLNVTSADNSTPTSFQYKNLKLEKR
ncbi:hypothetical protein [Alloprevotella tannerae]|uniref:hypothetical protein n=1 Tax=Alloprevotella tannerae TaxID=76122 RepID=UPI0028F05960|nr:hypothetical protein [Alloprevotella tannerae]